jgi:hypothetical protein
MAGASYCVPVNDRSRDHNSQCYAWRKASRGTRMVYDLTFLTESESGKSIAINPQLVRFVIEIDDKRVGVVFDKEHRIIIDGTVASISEQLRKAVR